MVNNMARKGLDLFEKSRVIALRRKQKALDKLHDLRNDNMEKIEIDYETITLYKDTEKMSTPNRTIMGRVLVPYEFGGDISTQLTQDGQLVAIPSIASAVTTQEKLSETMSIFSRAYNESEKHFSLSVAVLPACFRVDRSLSDFNVDDSVVIKNSIDSPGFINLSVNRHILVEYGTIKNISNKFITVELQEIPGQVVRVFNTAYIAPKLEVISYIC